MLYISEINKTKVLI